MLRPFEIEANLSPARRALFQYFWVTFGLLLFFASWKLWIGQEAYPQVPLFKAGCGMPAGVDAGLFAGVLGALLSLLLANEGSHFWRRSLNLFLICLGGLFCLDQHRLQPWAYQFWLIALAARVLSPGSVAYWWRWLVISIYFHSAISKLDLSFASELGQSFLTTGLGLVGISTEKWSESARLGAAFLFPVWELLVAICLCFRPLRIWGLAGAWIMHVAMLLILGPWGMNHHAGVLLWNLFFICQAGLLFWPCHYQGPECATGGGDPRDRNAGPRLVRWIYLVAMLAPFLQPWGWWDLWPSWGLYASHAERVSLWVHVADREKLPPTVREHLWEIYGEESWNALRLNRWSLGQLYVPVYPQGRFQLGVAEGVIQKYGLHGRFRVQFEHSPRFSWTTSRVGEEFRTLEELRKKMRGFLLNAEPRRSISRN
ncbi:MAG: hypothetical protein U0903_02135 [Planctomycetales bacterium]